jgi:predicted nucleotidyltransferase
MLDDTIIREHIKQIVKQTDNTAITILYGSRARGNAHIDSDWDILILLNKPKVSIEDEQIFRHKLYDLELEIGQSISTFVYSRKEWDGKLLYTPLHENIQLEGEIL